jgi:hypothetical protein
MLSFWSTEAIFIGGRIQVSLLGVVTFVSSTSYLKQGSIAYGAFLVSCFLLELQQPPSLRLNQDSFLEFFPFRSLFLLWWSKLTECVIDLFIHSETVSEHTQAFKIFGMCARTNVCIFFLLLIFCIDGVVWLRWCGFYKRVDENTFLKHF